MKTLEVLNMPEQELSPRLKQMKLKELERHAEKILAKLGQADYELVLRTLIRAIPKLNSEKIEPLSAVKNIVKGLIPTASNDCDVDDHLIERLTVILMMVVSRKFEKIMAST